jgi:hypothetical protein
MGKAGGARWQAITFKVLFGCLASLSLLNPCKCFVYCLRMVRCQNLNTNRQVLIADSGYYFADNCRIAVAHYFLCEGLRTGCGLQLL